MADSLKILETLKAGTFPDEQARAVTLAIRESEYDTRDWFRREFAILEERIDHRVDAKIANLRAELIRWMFLFWIGQMATTVGVVFAAFKLFR